MAEGRVRNGEAWIGRGVNFVNTFHVSLFLFVSLHFIFTKMDASGMDSRNDQ